MSSFVHRGSGPQAGKKIIRDTGRPQQSKLAAVQTADAARAKKVKNMLRLCDGIKTAISLLKEANARHTNATKVIRIAGRDSLVTVNEPLLRPDPDTFPPDDELVPPPTDGERDAAREAGMTVAEMRASNAAISQARADEEEEPTPEEMNALRQSLQPDKQPVDWDQWAKEQIEAKPKDAEGLSEAIEHPAAQQPASGTQTQEAAQAAAARANEAIRAKKNATDYATARLAANYVPSAEALRRIIEG